MRLLSAKTNPGNKMAYKDKDKAIEHDRQYRQVHKAEIAEYKRCYHQTHKAEEAAYARQYYQTHKVEKTIRDKKYRQTHKKEVAERQRQYRQTHRAKVAAHAWQYRQACKVDVLKYYGNGECACVNCGFNDIRALSLDHINGGGRKHFRELGGGGITFYIWLKENDCPEGYQTLCMNCQYIKRVANNEYLAREEKRR